MKLYFWVKLTRVTGRVGKGWHPSSTCDNSDAMASGIFSDSLTYVGYATVFAGQNRSDVFRKWSAEERANGVALGFTHADIHEISEREYKFILNKLEVET